MQNPERAFLFEYDARALTERVDLENQLRQNLTCADDAREIVWNFDADAQGWSAWNEIANSKIDAGAWRLDTTGSDPILGSPLVNVRGAQLGAIQIKMRARASQSPLKGEIYWRTRDMTDFSPARVASFDIIADGLLRDYEIVLPIPRDDIVAQLRFDPADAPAQLAVDSIKIVCK